MKKLQKLQLRDAKIMTSIQMQHIMGGSKPDCGGGATCFCTIYVYESDVVTHGYACGVDARDCEYSLSNLYGGAGCSVV